MNCKYNTANIKVTVMLNVFATSGPLLHPLKTCGIQVEHWLKIGKSK